MPDNISFNRKLSAFLLISCLIFIIYSNSFTASWHFDDAQNILLNPNLHLTDLSLSSFRNALFASIDKMAYAGEQLYRPVSCFSFALNWFFGGNDVFGYHLINTVIHILTAFFLFLTVLTFFHTPALKGKYKDRQYFIAFLTAIFWCVNPIQTQAVTYIVQRMTSLAALFYLLGIYCYLKARLGERSLSHFIFYGMCFLCFLLGVGSKENATFLPLTLLLVEIIFFQNLDSAETRTRIVKLSLLTSLIVFLISVLLFFLFLGNPADFISELYEYRPFTPIQRLLTEPRIIVFYISQIFYPVPSRLSLIHDFELFTSIFHPWMTLPAIILIFVFIIIGFFCIRKQPIIAFAIFFFFLNHILESSILPLELAYEHRNYLPSLFLFFPVAIGLIWLLDYYYSQKRYMYYIIIFFIVSLIIGLGSGTYIRNLAWATENSLWTDVLKKAPGTERPYQNIADYHKERGDYKKALWFYEKSLSSNLRTQNSHNSGVLALTNMGNIYHLMGDHKKALTFYNQALEIFPDDAMALYNSLFSLISLKMYDTALETINLLIEKQPENNIYLNLKGYIFLKGKKSEKALPYFKKSLKNAPGYIIAMINLGVSLSQLQEYDRAEWFFRLAKKKAPNEILTIFLLAENSLKSGDLKKADQYMDDLLSMRSVGQLSAFLKAHSADPLATPMSYEIIIPLFNKRLEAKAKQIDKILL